MFAYDFSSEMPGICRLDLCSLSFLAINMHCFLLGPFFFLCLEIISCVYVKMLMRFFSPRYVGTHSNTLSQIVTLYFVACFPLYRKTCQLYIYTVVKNTRCRFLSALIDNQTFFFHWKSIKLNLKCLVKRKIRPWWIVMNWLRLVSGVG